MKRKNKILGITAAAALALSAVVTSCCFLPEEDEKLDLSKMTLVWSDEFDTTLSSEDWNHRTGTGENGWGNNEVQSYRSSGNDSIIDDEDAEDEKALRITARKSGDSWTSARIDTSTKHSFKYGYFEARIKLPLAYDSSKNEVENKGVWPAFWMMPEDVVDEDGNSLDQGGVYGKWPRSGEIDIMEYAPGKSGDKVFATLHHAASKTDAKDTYPSLGSVQLPADGEYHTYGVMWKSGTIEAFYDGKSLGAVYSNPGNNWAKYPYDQEFYIILNLAMGGNLGGAINPEIAEAYYDIDYVRVYQ